MVCSTSSLIGSCTPPHVLYSNHRLCVASYDIGLLLHMLVPATLFVFLPHRFLLATNFNFSAGQSLLSACLVKVRLVVFPPTTNIMHHRRTICPSPYFWLAINPCKGVRNTQRRRLVMMGKLSSVAPCI